MDLDRPPLGDDVYESIVVAQHPIHKNYWHLLAQQIPNISAFDINSLVGMPPSPWSSPKPPPPKQPIRLNSTLGSYACALFDVEASKYPNKPEVSEWLLKLAVRIEDAVMQNVAAIDRGSDPFKLTYHASYDEMRTAVRASLRDHGKRFKVESSQASKWVRPDDPIEPVSGRLSTRSYLETLVKSPEPDTDPARHRSKHTKKKRLPATITSPLAARRLEAFLEGNVVSQTAFSIQAGVNERTLRRFRQTGKVRRDIFKNIATQMGTTMEELIKP